MKIMTINDLSNLDIRDMIEEFGYSLEGFIISREDFGSIRAIAVQYLKKESASLEVALRWAFLKRMEFTGQLNKVLSAKSEAERKKVCSICPDEGAGHQQRRRHHRPL